MEAVRNNKFLTGFIAVMVIGVGVLGYLVYSSQAQYAEVSQNYDTQVAELKRLQALKPFPEEANLQVFNDRKKEYSKAVLDLQAKLAGMEPPVEQAVSPTEFQNRLREVVRNVTAKAQQVGVALPDGFYLGFEQYRESLPDAAATPLLTNQLSAIEQIVGILLNQRIDKLNAVRRALLAQEGGASGSNAVSTAAGPASGAPKAPPGAEMVVRQSVEIDFISPPSSFREALNQITLAPRLYIIRALQVKNLQDKSPVRGQQDAPPGGTGTGSTSQAQTSGNPGDQPLPDKGPPPMRYVFGQEKLQVVARIELTKVLPAPAKR
jgi:hypothetical protein